MKKTISLVCLTAIILIMSISAFAGDVPESLLYEDNAKVFLGTVENYTKKETTSAPYYTINYIEIIPTEKIKGDVTVGVKEEYSNCYGLSELKPNVEYLFGYFDKNNIYIYEIETKENKHFKLVNSDKYDMTKRVENYLNDGLFEKAENERLTKIENYISETSNPSVSTTPEKPLEITIIKPNLWIRLSIILLIPILIIIYVVKKKKR